MRKLYKICSVAALSSILSLSLALNANAQHHPGNGGGGGNNNPPPASSGGGGHVSMPAPSAPAPRPSNGGYQQPRSNSGGYQQRQNNNYSRPAGTNGAVRVNGVTGQRYNVRQPSPLINRQYQGHTGISATPRNNGVTAHRYRTSPGLTYGRNRPGYPYRGGHLPGNTYYHYNHGYYGTYYAPRLGFSIGVLPYGYYPFYFDDYQYFYSNGLFYQYDNDEYTVVDPPVGAEIKTLPSDAQSIMINGEQYYEVNGVYYKPVTKDDGTLTYEVAGKDGELNTTDDGQDVNNPPAPQIGDIVPSLPPDCRKIKLNNQTLYLSPDGIYYKAQVDQDGAKSYTIVGLPDDTQDQDQDQQGGDQ